MPRKLRIEGGENGNVKLRRSGKVSRECGILVRAILPQNCTACAGDEGARREEMMRFEREEDMGDEFVMNLQLFAEDMSGAESIGAGVDSADCTDSAAADGDAVVSDDGVREGDAGDSGVIGAAEREEASNAESAEKEGAGIVSEEPGVNGATDGDEDARLRAHFDGLMVQAEEMRRAVPTFDLAKELEDPNFFRWTSPQVGMSVKQAYMAVHGEKMMREAIKYAIDRTRANLGARVRAAQTRPREGGLSGGSGANVGFDVSRMSKRDRAEVRERVARGERVVLE